MKQNGNTGKIIEMPELAGLVLLGQRYRHDSHHESLHHFNMWLYWEITCLILII